MSAAQIIDEIREYGLSDFIKQKITGALARLNVIVNIYQDQDAKQAIGKISEVKRKTRLGLRNSESLSLYNLVLATRKVSGDIAEVGVYKAGSALLICKARQGKALHLFDTFEGLPKVRSIDGYKRGDYKAPKNIAEQVLLGEKKIFFYPGFFPKTTKGLEQKKFSVVHLDVDIYQSTKDALEFFYPRLSKGAIILSHDYPNSKGVRKAFDEFFEDKPEPIIRLAGCQCMIMKC